MQIAKNSVVTIDYTLKDKDGTLLDSSNGEPLSYLHGYGQLITGIEKNLEGKKTGESFKLVIPPNEAYGEYDDKLIKQISKKEMQITEKLEIGTPIEFNDEKESMIYFVTALDGDKVTLNGNHPLAGVTLYFDLEIKDVREATKEELEHKHAHFGHHEHECNCNDGCHDCE